MQDLAIDRVLTPLVCYFIDCDSIWLSETRRQVDSLVDQPDGTGEAAEIRWQSLPFDIGTPGNIQPDSLAVLHATASGIESHLELIHRLYQKNVTVAVVGDPDVVQHLLAIRAAGAVTVVTDIFGCDKLASIISKAAMIKPHIITSWRTRFVNQLPWQPV